MLIYFIILFFTFHELEWNHPVLGKNGHDVTCIFLINLELIGTD